jgi:hypothetical protein
MWYNVDNKMKPDGATDTPGAANLDWRLACLLYHKDASVLVAPNGSPQASLSVSQASPTSYEHGVGRVPLSRSRPVAIGWSCECVPTADRNTSAGTVKAGSAIRVAPPIATPTWSKARKCALCAGSVDASFHQIAVISSTAHAHARRWRYAGSQIKSAAAHIRRYGGLLCIPALAVIKSFVVLRIRSGRSKFIVRIDATCDAGAYRILKTA